MDDMPTMQCPKCGYEEEDFDGFGFIGLCPKCGHCNHPNSTLENGKWICGICGQEVTHRAAQIKREEEVSVEEILKKHGVYTRDLEIDLLRHFVDLRNEILQGVKNTEQQVQADSYTPNSLT